MDRWRDGSGSADEPSVIDDGVILGYAPDDGDGTGLKLGSGCAPALGDGRLRGVVDRTTLPDRASRRDP